MIIVVLVRGLESNDCDSLLGHLLPQEIFESMIAHTYMYTQTHARTHVHVHTDTHAHTQNLTPQKQTLKKDEKKRSRKENEIENSFFSVRAKELQRNCN